MVQTGVRGKAEQRSRAAVRRIQAGAGSGPRERGDTAKRDICWPATAPRRPPGPSCLGEGRKPAFSHCHCVPDRFVNQLGSSSASHAGCRSSLTGEEEEGKRKRSFKGTGRGRASRAGPPEPLLLSRQRAVPGRPVSQRINAREAGIHQGRELLALRAWRKARLEPRTPAWACVPRRPLPFTFLSPDPGQTLGLQGRPVPVPAQRARLSQQ